MSELVEIPQYLRARSGEEISQAFLAWIENTKQKLLKAFPPGEKAFCRILDKMKSRLPQRWQKTLWYTRQKWFIITSEIVYFGDFYFRNLHLLAEIDGASHLGEAARIKDDWRTKLISSTRKKMRVSRLTNAQTIDGDFREAEQWFIREAAAACPLVGRKLKAQYEQMTRRFPDLYSAEGVVTTYPPHAKEPQG